MDEIMGIRTPDELRGAVAKGAIFLDEVQPDWWERIELSTLMLSSPSCCVLGQLASALGAEAGVDKDENYLGFGSIVIDPEDIADGCDGPIRCVEHLHLTTDSAVRFGFEIHDPEGRMTFADSDREYGALDDAWADEITSRRHLYAD